MAWTCSRAMLDDATSSNQWQWHRQSYLLLYIHHELTWTWNIRVFCLEVPPSPGAFILTGFLQILEHRAHLNTEQLQKRQVFLNALSLLFFEPTFSPFSITNPFILLEGSLTPLKYHSDTSKCLLKGPAVSQQLETPQTRPEHWPLRSQFTYNNCAPSFVCFQVI